MKKIAISLLGLSVIGLANASDKNGDLKSSAIMQATCLISANNISFGTVAVPLLEQTANNDMTVKCSNTSAYTIDLAYGGIYGSNTNNGSGDLIKFYGEASVYNNYEVLNSLGSTQGTMQCGYAGAYVGYVHFQTTALASYYGYTSSDWQLDNNKACTTDGTKKGTYPTGWQGAYNATGTQPRGGTSYAYGIMNGMSKGDKLAYSIAVPGDVNKVWNAGNNSYKSTGNGDFQIIPVVAKIVPDKSGSKYPAPDMYLDTVTAVISY